MKNKLQIILFNLIVLMVLGCGGSSDSNDATQTQSYEEISGRAIDGYLRGATVCVDANLNQTCDDGEVSATTTEGGYYTLEVGADDIDKPLVLEADTDTFDEGFNQYLTKPLKLFAPAKSEVLTPLTTVVQNYMYKKFSKEEAEQKAVESLKITKDELYENFVENGKTAIREKAEYIAQEIQANESDISGVVEDVVQKEWIEDEVVDEDSIQTEEIQSENIVENEENIEGKDSEENLEGESELSLDEVVAVSNVRKVSKPILFSAYNVTNLENTLVTILGEVNTQVYIDNKSIGKISSDGNISINFDTSGDSEDKIFDIYLKDSFGNRSDEMNISITKGIWEDKDTSLMWQDDNATYEMSKNFEDATSYCDELIIGQYEDWRVPSLDELFTIVDINKTNPALKNGLLYLSAQSYWSSDIYENNQTLAMGINFYDGSDGISYKTTSRALKCVRGNSIAKTTYTRVDGQNLVSNDNNQTLWQDDEIVDSRFLTFDEAKTYCNDLNLSNHTNWRLPDITELRSIVDRENSNPAIKSAFSNSVNGFFWSSSEYAPNQEKIWSILFTDGNDYQHLKSDRGYVRCIKNQ
jgi:hypothetical protein